jgi:hypothetical protein
MFEVMNTHLVIPVRAKRGPMAVNPESSTPV